MASPVGGGGETGVFLRLPALAAEAFQVDALAPYWRQRVVMGSGSSTQGPWADGVEEGHPQADKRKEPHCSQCKNAEIFLQFG